MTANISSLYQGTGEQEASFPEILPVSVPPLHISDVLGSRAEQARPWRVALVSLPARGGGALAVLPALQPPCPSPSSMAPPQLHICVAPELGDDHQHEAATGRAAPAPAWGQAARIVLSPEGRWTQPVRSECGCGCRRVGLQAAPPPRYGPAAQQLCLPVPVPYSKSHDADLSTHRVSSPRDLPCLGCRPEAPSMLSPGPALSSDSDKEGEDEGTEEEELPALPILATGTKKEPGLCESSVGPGRHRLGSDWMYPQWDWGVRAGS